MDILRHLPFVRVAQPVRFPAGTGAGNRAAPRREIAADVELREAGREDEALPLHLCEVSATGAFVRSELLLPVGAPVELCFRLADRRDLIRAEGRVVRVEDDGQAPGMGIQFERMAPDARATLRAYTLWS
jgi:uncharacterized protein (TIGR02266 family)